MTSFLESVAARANVDVDSTRELLDRYAIVAQPHTGKPVQLQIRRLQFSGTKTTSDVQAPVNFDRAFDTGLTVIASDHNLVGKSTLLWLIRWALTGRRPDAINAQIASWIDKVALEATVGSTAFQVAFNVAREQFEGRLTVDGRPEQRFSTETGFETTMADFLLDALGLAKLPGFQKQKGRHSEEEGSAVFHGWATHFPALHIRGDLVSVLLGDHREHQPGLLLQVFLGLPWALTHRAADVAVKVLGNSRAAATRLQATQVEQLGARLKPLNFEIAQIDEKLEALDEAGPTMTAVEVEERHSAYATALRQSTEAGRLVDESRMSVADAQALLDEVEKVHRAVRERRVLRPLLKALAPVHCPRCEEGFEQERLAAEEHDHQCSVCARPLTAGEDELSDADFEQAEQDLEASRANLRAAEDRLQTAEQDATQRDALVREARAVLPTVDRVAAVTSRQELMLRRAELAGRIAQAREAVNQDAASDEDPAERRVLEAALAEADERRKVASAELLERLGKEIVRVGVRIGMRDLQEARPNLAARLPMTIAGHPDKFGGRTGGERLRLKIATVVALLRVGEQSGVGRHPGLLLIDSPGGEEMDPEDLRVVLGELDRLCSETPHMQIVVATARGPVVRDAVSESRIIHGEDWGPIW